MFNFRREMICSFCSLFHGNGRKSVWYSRNIPSCHQGTTVVKKVKNTILCTHQALAFNCKNLSTLRFTLITFLLWSFISIFYNLVNYFSLFFCLLFDLKQHRKNIITTRVFTKIKQTNKSSGVSKILCGWGRVVFHHIFWQFLQKPLNSKTHDQCTIFRVSPPHN